MTSTKRARADLYEAVQREAAHILCDLLDNVAAIRPMPDGRKLFVLDLDDVQLDRLAAWGSQVEDIEPDADFEDDCRDLPKVKDAFAAPVFAASLLLPVEEPAPAAVADIAAVKPLPDELRELAEKIAA